MDILGKKNRLLLTAAVMVVVMGIMALGLVVRKPKIEDLFTSEIRQIQTQSESTKIEAIEKDLNETDLSDIDKELREIENELNSAF